MRTQLGPRHVVFAKLANMPAKDQQNVRCVHRIPSLSRALVNAFAPQALASVSSLLRQQTFLIRGAGAGVQLARLELTNPRFQTQPAFAANRENLLPTRPPLSAPSVPSILALE